MFRITSFVTAATVALVTTGSAVIVAGQDRDKAKPATEEAEVIADAIEVLEELTASPDDGIPRHLLKRAEAIVVIPSLIKGGFIVGAKHGKGVMSLRDGDTWSNPAFVKLTGGSIGWQIGVESVDLVMLVMNKKGVDELLEDRFTIGGTASLAAGPVGRQADAATNAQLSAEILAYSKAKGLFAGATLEGAGLHADDSDNEDFYGADLNLRQVLERRTSDAPTMASTWRTALRAITGDQVR
jgi:lipid-binding SYLF domain-containing protein